MKRILALLLLMMMAPAALAEGALVPRPLPPIDLAHNPYMADSDNSIHNDAYASDVTDAVAPLGIDSTVSAALETQNVQAPPAAFYDSRGNAITPFLGGIAIADLDGDTITRSGSFVPRRDDAGMYNFQISYAFVDAQDHVVAPTSHGHVLVMRTMNENGGILPTFQKLLDVDIVSLAKQALGEDIDKRLLSIVYDYEGNLWFVTGGFRIYPDRDPAGFIGYIDRTYMAALGEGLDLSEHVHFLRLDMGESAENGIAANEDGAVILTNLACYMLNARNGVEVVWRTPYGSNGANDAAPGSAYTGGGLSWGSGTTPTLTGELVIFTDNLDPINLLALSSKTGEIVAQSPVLDGLDAGVPVAVENSILVYSSGDGNAVVLVCNWFGAGNAGLSALGADSSILSYANIYDANWMSKGNAYIAPGVERVDFIKTDAGYEARKVWFREDISDTSMMKLSTATGYFYGYWQDVATGMWVYEALDYDTGKTLLRQPVSDDPGYNNVAVGLIVSPKGNGIYCPTNAMVMARWQDNFACLSGKPLDPADTARYTLPGAASYLMEVQAQAGSLTLRLNGLTASPGAYDLIYRDADGVIRPYPGEWTLCAEGGTPLADAPLDEATLYEIRLPLTDGAAYDLDEADGPITVAVALKLKEE